MSQSDRKELKQAHTKPEVPTLKPFYKTATCFSEDFKVEIDDLSKRLIEKGDSRELNLFDDEVKATLGQRYVIIVLMKNNIAHLRAIPGFEYVESVSKRKTLAEKAAKFFECKEEDVAFPNHAIWTGVVHQQLIEQIRKNEPSLLEDSTIIAFSMTKNNGKYSWLNRSAINEDVFCPDSLASACYIFEEKSDYTGYKPPAFDLYYHLKRAIPEKIFKKLITALTEKICEDDPTPLKNLSLDECTNFSYELKWQVLQKLFNEDKAKAIEIIQHMLMRNLHVYLSGLSAPNERARAEDIIKEGFKATKELGLLIDIDSNPPEFSEDSNALVKAQKDINYGILTFLAEYRRKYVLQLYIISLKEGQIEKANALLGKLSETDKKVFMIEIILNAEDNENFEVINILYEASQLKSEKEQICRSVCAYIRINIISAKYDIAKKYIESLPRVVLFDYIKENYLAYYFGDTFFSFPLLHRFCETILEEKQDFNKKNEDGLSLLHLAASSTGGAHVVAGLLAHYADPYITDNDGLTPLHYAAKNCYLDTLEILLENKVDPNVKDGRMKLPLEYALAEKDLFAVQKLLEHGARFPHPFLLSDDLAIILKESISMKRFTILRTLMQTISKEENPILQAKILSIVYQAFTNILLQFESKFEDGIKRFLELHNIDLTHAIDFDPKKIMDGFFSILENMGDQRYKLEFIDLMLNERSCIGQSLLLDKTYGNDFRKKLHDIKWSVRSKEYCKLFQLNITGGYLDKAKMCIQLLPKQIILPCIQKDKHSSEIICHLAEILSEEKTDFSKKNTAGETCLHIIAKSYAWSDAPLVSSLLLHGVNPNILDSEGNSALSIAANELKWLLVKLLVENKADPNLGCPNGKTPLEIALEKNEKQVVFLLLQYGAKFPETFALDSAYVNRIMQSLKLMLSLSLSEMYGMCHIKTLKETITLQENPKIKAKILGIIFSLFYDCMLTNSVSDVTRFLNIRRLPEIDSFDFDQKSYIDLFYRFLNLQVKNIQPELIDCILKPESSIGRKLLKADCSSIKTFPSLGDIFRQTLMKIKSSIEEQMICDEQKASSPTCTRVRPY